MVIKRTFKEISTRHRQVEILNREQFFKAVHSAEIFKGKDDNNRAAGLDSLGLGMSCIWDALAELQKGKPIQTFFSIYEPA